MADTDFILWFQEIGMDDVARVGGKNASLGEMAAHLGPKGVSIPPGFAVTAAAYRHFMVETGLEEKVRERLAELDAETMDNLPQVGRRIRRAIRAAEDLPEASFAGQQETYLNIRGAEELLEACRKCFASLFTNRAISYRHDKGFDHFDVALAVGVQKMVRSDKACAGVLFTIDTESGFPDAVLINAAWGLGENVVSGAVNPDEYYVFKPTLQEGFRPVIGKNLGTKEKKVLYTEEGAKSTTREVSVPREDRSRFCLEDDEILELARLACIIEDHYGRPMDVEWAKDGDEGTLYIVQARPETVQSVREKNVFETYHLKEEGEVLLTGKSVGGKIGAGEALIIKNAHEIERFGKGAVLVTDMTDPDWEPVMKKAAAIVTNRGGRTCHAAIVSRELGIPCVIGTDTGTADLKDGQEVTVSCAEGETGKVYEGMLDFEIEKTDIKDLKRPRTQIMMNLGNPGQAFALSRIPNDGVGLARLEFIINNAIQAHPLALLEPNQVADKDARQRIRKLIAGYPDGREFFIAKLAQGVGTIAAAFHPRDVIVRMSDFKTNEYAGLLGGEGFEPRESNPMIGFRGASRYYDERYREGFLLECEAMRRVRDAMGLKNVKLMIPFCRTVDEGRRVIEVMREAGLRQGEDGLEVYVMCEIPSNVVLAEEFAEVFDGFSIGSNDLTQLILGLDRDSEIVAHLYDERNAAVKRMIADVIGRAREADRKIGICGQAPSDYPEFAEFLVECGIDSISLNPDTVLKTTQRILEVEKKLGQGE